MTDPTYAKSDPAILQNMKNAFLEGLDPENCWVFAYGSLLWNPGFPPEKRELVTVEGWQRSFCVYSYHYRGTEENPGLILGLDKGLSCQGMALKVTPDECETVMSALWDREMISGIYDPVCLELSIGGIEVNLHAFVIDRDNPQYAGNHSPEDAAHIIHSAQGSRGPNRDYVINTFEVLNDYNIHDAEMAAIVKALRSF